MEPDREHAKAASDAATLPQALAAPLAYLGFSLAGFLDMPAPGGTYKVHAGDTLQSIAAKLGVTVEALKAANQALLKTWHTDRGGTTQGFVAGVTITVPAVAPAPPPAAAAPARPPAAAVQQPAPSPPDVKLADAEGTPVDIGGAAIDTNLGAAKSLADSMKVPHTWDAPNLDGDPTNSARKNTIISGAISSLKTIVCSEFTMLSLRKSGVNLADRYLERSVDPPLPVAVPGKGSPHFIDLYSVTNNQGDAAAALMAVQRGTARTIQPGSPEAKALKSTEAGAFLYVDSLGALAPKDGDHFGAGAAAISLGGVAVAQDQRRPGDIQQKWKTTKGTSVAAGHSSTVWSVRGKGVAYFGAANSPKLVPVPKYDIPPGWYRADEIYWELEPDTDPALVGELSVEYVQLIEANTEEGRGSSDATGLSKMSAADPAYDPDAKASSLTSTGRLPSSKWNGGPATPGPLAGTLTAKAIVP